MFKKFRKRNFLLLRVLFVIALFGQSIFYAHADLDPNAGTETPAEPPVQESVEPQEPVAEPEPAVSEEVTPTPQESAQPEESPVPQPQETAEPAGETPTPSPTASPEPTSESEEEEKDGAGKKKDPAEADEEIDEELLKEAKNTIEYMPAGSFEGEIGSLFTVKAEYEADTFPLFSMFSLSSYLEPDDLAKAKEKMIELSGKTEEEITVRSLHGMEIAFKRSYSTDLIQPENDHAVKISLSRKDSVALADDENYQLLHWNGTELEPVDFTVDEEGVIHFESKSFSPFYLGILGAPVPPVISGLTLPVDCPMLNSQGQDGEGVYHFPIHPGTDGVFNITIPKEAFHGTNFRLSVDLPAGMKFDQGGLENLKAKAEILGVEYDANSLKSVVVTLKADPSTLDDLSTALAFHTEIDYMSQTDLSDIIANGPKKTTIAFRLTDSNGGLMGENTRYTVRPKTGNTATPSITSIFTTEPAEISASTAVNDSDSKWYYFQQHLYPLVKLNVPEVDKDNSKLIRIKRIKIYRPVGLEDLCWPSEPSIHSSMSAGGTYKKVNTDPLTDAGGTYDVFEIAGDSSTDPYNKLKQTEIWATWKFKKNEFIPADTLFEAADTEVTFETEGGEEITLTTTGVKMKTPKSVYDDQFKVTPKLQYKKNTTNIKTVNAGHPAFKQKFIDVYNNMYSVSYPSNDELIMSEGAYTETYHFPYEIRPTDYHRARYFDDYKRALGKMTLIITKADGSVETKEVPENDIKYSQDISFTSYMEAGDRLSGLTLEWDRARTPATGTDDPFTLDYNVTRTHEDGSPLTTGELIQIGYEVEHKKRDGSSYTYSTASDPDYLYVKVGEETCNDFMEEGISGTQTVYTFGQSPDDNASYAYAGNIYFRGDEYSYKSLYKNPVITLRARSTNINGIEEPISFIGGFSLSQRMSGWKVIYSSYNKTTGETKTNQEYTIPDSISGSWNSITKTDIGLADDEYFTGIRLQYDGDLLLDYIKDMDYTEGHKLIFRLFNVLIDPKRDRSLYHDQEVSVTGAPTDRGRIEVDAFFKCDNPCPGVTPTDPDGVESQVDYHSLGLLFGPKGASWVISHRGFKSDDRTVIAYQGGIATAEESEDYYYSGMSEEKSGAFNGVFWAERNDLNSNETHADSTIKMDAPEAVYIELTDPEFDVASVEAEQASSSPWSRRQPITANEVSVITVNGKRYLKISSGSQNGHFSKNTQNGWAASLSYDLAKINLQAWNGAMLGDHHPFGAVYYDISGLLTKYDGSPASGNVKYAFNGAVPDTDDIRGTGDTTTPSLFRVGDMSAFTVRVLQHVLNGVQLYPGKNNVVDRLKPVTFLPHEKSSLLVSEQIHIPGTTSLAEVIIKLPSKGEEVSFTTFDTSGHEINETKTNEYTMNLTGTAITNHTSGLSATDTIEYSYSTDGTTYVPESSITSPGDWKNYRYVKMTLHHKVTPGSDANIEVRIPLEAEEEAAKENDLHAYVTGTYHFLAGTEATDAKCSSAEYIFRPYEVHGVLWRDKNEDGVLDTDAPIGEGSGIVVSLNDASGNEIGSTANAVSGKLNADGTFTIRTNHEDTAYSVSLQLPADLKVTKHTGTGDPTTVNTDSDFDRTSLKTQTFHSFDTSGHAYNVSGGIIRLPKLPHDDQFIHVTDSPRPLELKATSENPDQPNPPITYTAVNDPVMDLDTTGTVTPKKTGALEHLQMQTSNTLGDVVTGEFNAYVYANVVYKYEESGVYGSVPVDSHRYYPSADPTTDDAIVLGPGTLKRSGYRLTGWKDETGHIYHTGEHFTIGEVEDDIVLIAVWTPIPPSPPVRVTPRPLVPNTSDTLFLGAYMVLLIASVGIAWVSVRNLYKSK